MSLSAYYSHSAQAAFEEAEGSFRSQIKILEEEVSRKQVSAVTCKPTLSCADTCNHSETHERHGEAIPARTSSYAQHHPRLWHGRRAQPPWQTDAAESTRACELARAATAKRECDPVYLADYSLTGCSRSWDRHYADEHTPHLGQPRRAALPSCTYGIPQHRISHITFG